MFGFPSRATVERLKQEYQKGTAVELVHMEDPYRDLAAGTKGTVSCVDDAGTIHIDWENGCRLGAVYGEDIVRKCVPS